MTGKERINHMINTNTKRVTRGIDWPTPEEYREAEVFNSYGDAISHITLDIECNPVRDSRIRLTVAVG